MSIQSLSFTEIATAAIEGAFLTLLESKHLYQSVEISTSGFAHYVDREAQKDLSFGASSSRTKDQILDDCRNKAVERLRQTHFQMIVRGNTVQTGSFSVSVPTIKAVCQNTGCGGLWPHNASTDPSWLPTSASIASGLQQIFALQYQCQACKKEPITFLVKKDGLKLTLTGRSPIEAVNIPKFVPKLIRKFYKGALVAFDSGAILPGIFMLRTMIEQHMRSAVNAGQQKMTGDELADAYAATLHPDFNRIYQSLKPIYSTLSEAIHAAIDDKPELFDQERAKILSHFEAKESFNRLSLR